MFEAADVVVSLQRAAGLTGDRQFPSKIAEFMVKGKVVVTTVFGDIDDIPSSAVLKLHEESASALADLLQGLCRSRSLLTKMSFAAADYARTAFAVEAGARSLRGFLLDIGYAHAAVVKPPAKDWSRK